MNFSALQNSAFLQALGTSILHSLWQVFLLWAVFHSICLSYKSAKSAFKNKLSTGLVFMAFIWFIFTFASCLVKSKSEVLRQAASSDLSGANAIDYLPGFSLMGDTIDKIVPYLSISYIFLLLFLTMKLISSYRYVSTITRRRLIEPPALLRYFATRVAAHLEIPKSVQIWISNNIDVPATIGFFKPVILIPLASVSNLSLHQLEAIVLHELAHIKRNDYIINLFISVIETILFFNPFIALLARTIKSERENCCDDFVIQYRYDPHSYASALLSLEKLRLRKLQLAIGAVSGKKELLERIKRMTNQQLESKQFNYGQKLLALILITGIISSLAWLSPAKQNKHAVLPVGVANVSLKKRKLPSIEISETLRQVQIAEDKTIVKKSGNVKASNSLTFQFGKTDEKLAENIALANVNPLKGNLDHDWKNFNFEFNATSGFNITQLIKRFPVGVFNDILPRDLNLNVDIKELNKTIEEKLKDIEWEKIDDEKIANSLKWLAINKLSKRRSIEELTEGKVAEMNRHLKLIKGKSENNLPFSETQSYFYKVDSGGVVYDLPDSRVAGGRNRARIPAEGNVMNKINTLSPVLNFYIDDDEIRNPEKITEALLKTGKISHDKNLKGSLKNISADKVKNKRIFRYVFNNTSKDKKSPENTVTIEITDFQE